MLPQKVATLCAGYKLLLASILGEHFMLGRDENNEEMSEKATNNFDFHIMYMESKSILAYQKIDTPSAPISKLFYRVFLDSKNILCLTKIIVKIIKIYYTESIYYEYIYI